MTSEYHYIGKDGKTVLARDLEDERDALKVRVAEIEAQNELYRHGVAAAYMSGHDAGRAKGQCAEVKSLLWTMAVETPDVFQSGDYSIAMFGDKGRLTYRGEHIAGTAHVKRTKDHLMDAAKAHHKARILSQVTTRSASEVWQEAIGAAAAVGEENARIMFTGNASDFVQYRDETGKERGERIRAIPNPYEVKE